MAFSAKFSLNGRELLSVNSTLDETASRMMSKIKNKLCKCPICGCSCSHKQTTKCTCGCDCVDVSELKETV